MDRLNINVLLIAYACEPNKGSEPGVGWNWAINLSKYINLTVLTRLNNKFVIEKEIRNKDINIKIIYYDIPILQKIKKKIPLGIQIYYTIWQLFSVLIVKYKMKSSFDIVHHVTFNSFSLPTFGWLISKNFIWGPIGGGQTFPFNIYISLSKKNLFELIRTIAIKMSKFNLLIITISYLSKKILVANKETYNKIWFKDKIIRFLETGIDKSILVTNNKIPNNRDQIILLWVGELKINKAPFLLLDALKYVKHSVKVYIIGDGDLKVDIIKKSKKYNLLNKIIFIGKIEHREIWNYYKNSDIFLFTSMRDTSGNVVLEAMSQGLPIIAFDHQGMHDILTDECAIKIPVTNYKQMVDDLAKAIDKLSNDPELRFKMGQASIKRIKEHYLWEDKAKRMVEIYKEVLNENSSNS